MNSHQFGTRSKGERDAWLQRREDWRRNNPAPQDDEQTTQK